MFIDAKLNLRNPNTNLENDVDSDITSYNLDIPKDQWISWGSSYYWKLKSEGSTPLYLIYVPDSYKFIVVEETI